MGAGEPTAEPPEHHPTEKPKGDLLQKMPPECTPDGEGL